MQNRISSGNGAQSDLTSNGKARLACRVNVVVLSGICWFSLLSDISFSYCNDGFLLTILEVRSTQGSRGFLVNEDMQRLEKCNTQVQEGNLSNFSAGLPFSIVF